MGSKDARGSAWRLRCTLLLVLLYCKETLHLVLETLLAVLVNMKLHILHVLTALHSAGIERGDAASGARDACIRSQRRPVCGSTGAKTLVSICCGN